MQKRPVLETSGLCIGYQQRRKKRIIIHDSLHLQLFAGEMTGLLGLNGAGKSTLLRTICGFQPALEGSIYVNGRLLSDYSPAALSRLIGVVLTDKTNAGGMTVSELVSLGRQPYSGFFGVLQADDKRIVKESLAAVGMTHMADCTVAELSDGERQKVMIAKVLSQQCPVIILDEPTAYLDVTSRIETMSLLRRLAVEQQKAILLSTHDLELAIQMSDCLWLMDKKRAMAYGTPEDLIMSGDFETFFNKKGITFDVSTGKLSADKPTVPIIVEGEHDTVFWVGNALIRNGFKPSSGIESHEGIGFSSKNESKSKIFCHHPKQISLFLSETEEIKVTSVAELITFILHSKENGIL